MFERRGVHPDDLFTEADRAAIRQAVGEAEAGTSAEVVPYVVDRCDDYPGAAWLAALLGSLVAAVTAGLVYALRDSWGGADPLWLTLPAFVGAAVGLFLALISPAIRRRLISEDLIERRVEHRAAAAFVEQEVFATRDRTGVLIFVSLFEHRALILADEGLNRVVESPEWEDIVARMTGELHDRHPREAMVGAIEACGRLLHERRFEPRPNDTDELGNALRTSRD